MRAAPVDGLNAILACSAWGAARHAGWRILPRVTSTPDPLPDGRIEPHIDWQATPDAGRVRPRVLPGPQARAWWPWLLGTVVLVGLASAVLLRKPIAERLWQGTRVQALLDQGNAAIGQGRLSAADGSGARQRFEAALALDNDRSEARDGLARVGRAAIVQAQAALKSNDLQAARQALLLARQLQVPQAQSDAIAADLSRHQANAAGIGTLIANAVAARAAGRIDGTPDAALPLFKQILALQPDNTIALEGREDLLSDQLQQARKALQARQLAQGAAVIDSVRGYDAGHYDLPGASAQLARALDQARRQADTDLRRDRLEAAVRNYQDVLVAAPNDPAASLGLQNAAAQYAQRARRQAADFDFDSAQADLQQARALAPQSPAVAEVVRAIERAHRSQAQLEQAMPASPQRQRRVRALLADADRAAARGDWIDPPGESAFDKLRAAQALAPDDAVVRRASQRLLPDVQQCVSRELAANRVRAAQTCLDAWQAIAPGDGSLAHARRQLAMRWIDIGTERLGAGELRVASEALQRARGLDRAAPGLDDFAARVAHARGGGG
jgi:tetratricopeptide (TPR) repeat protein